MATRLAVRSAQDNSWLDQCSSEYYFRDGFNANWIRFYPEQTQVRNSGNNRWLQVSCEYDPVMDAYCATHALVSSVTCTESIPIEEAGSGDGLGSKGPEFDILRGYPAGYDLPDANRSGFGIQRAYGTFEGNVLNRPGLDGRPDSYDSPGTNSFYGRGIYENPSYPYTHTFSVGTAVTETVYELGQQSGFFEILYACYHQDGISIDAYYLGSLIASTCGRVKGRGKLDFSFNPNVGNGESRIMIRVRGVDKTRWMYSVVGPKAVLPIQNFEPGNNRDLAQIRTFDYIGTSLFPAPAHSRVTPFKNRLRNGQYWYEYVHHVGLVDPATGPYVLHLNYETWQNADWFEVYHGGERIASTLGQTNKDGLLSIVFDPWRFNNAVPDIVVKVMAQEREFDSDIESQEYMLYDPNVRGYKENRWPCEVPEAGITSAGHHSTEDHYRMNNLDQDGVASVKVKGFGNFRYVASVFDKKGNLVTAKQGQGTIFLQWLRLEDSDNYDDLLDISVRVDCPIDSSWTYWVGCYVPILDVEIDDQLVEKCPDIQIGINSVSVPEGSKAVFTVALNYPTDRDITVNYRTEDITATSTRLVGGKINPYPLYRQSGSVSSVIYEDDASNYTLMLEADPHRLYADDLNYNQGDSSNTYKDWSEVDRSVATYEALPAYYQMLVNMFKQRLGSLNSNTKILVLTHQRIAHFETPYDPDPRVDEQEYDVIYDMATVMDHMIVSLEKIYGVQVDVKHVNYYGPHRREEDRLNSNSATWSTHYDKLDDYDIVVVDQYDNWIQHREENSDIQSATDMIEKVFEKEQATKFGVALARSARNTSKSKVIICTAANDVTTFRSGYKYMNANAKDVINAFGITSQVNIADESSSLSNLSNVDRITVQEIKDVAGDSYLWEGIKGSDYLSIQNTSKRMTKFIVANIGSQGAPETPVQDADYESKSGSLRIPKGSGSVPLSINTFSDSIKDPNEQFKVIISDPSDGEIIQDTGIATILETAQGARGDMDILVNADLYSIGTAKVTATQYAHPETIISMKINADQIRFSWTQTQGRVSDGSVGYNNKNGSVAVFTMNKTADSVTTEDYAAGLVSSSKELAQFEFDSNRTYTYKWKVTNKSNSIPGNRVFVRPYCAFKQSAETANHHSDIEEYHADNTCMSIQFERAVSSTSLAGTATFEVEIFVKDDLGNVQKSSPITAVIQQKSQVYYGGGGGGCLAIETPILMADGTYKNAEHIEPGDQVDSRWFPGMVDENTKGWENWTTDNVGTYETFVSTVKTARMDWFKQYWIINSDVRITQEHHVFAKRNNTWTWRDVRELEVGDKLYGKDGHEIYLGTLELVKEPIDVMVIDIEENDTYFAGKNSFLVHNAQATEKQLK